MTSDTEHPTSEIGEADLVETPGTIDGGSAEPTVEPETTGEGATSASTANSKKKKVPPKASAEVLQRRREGRIKAAATIANNLKKTGIGRFEEENGFSLTSVKQIPLINQKNYFADYLKKDEQVSFIRNWRSEKLMQANNNNKLKKALKKEDTDTPSGEVRNFEDFNLGDIEEEMNRKAAAAAAALDDEEDEDEEENEVEGEGDVEEEISEEKARLGFDTIVIQPGSSNVRIGRATDAFPRTVPAVIAVRKHTKEAKSTTPHVNYPIRTIQEDGSVFFSENFDQVKDVVTKDFKARMKYYKRRILPNSRESAANYNKRQEPERIPDHNDPYKKEWLDSNETKTQEFFVGDEALKLPIKEQSGSIWKLRFPIVNGNFSESEDYESPQEVLGDLAHIVETTLASMDVSNFTNLKVLLVIPDLYDKVYVENWCDMLFKQLNFSKVAIIQESVAATFGAGAQSACVVDVGAQTTTISCVDEGLIINDSRIVLNYGGDHITETFMKLLLQSSFPYHDINLKSFNDDWELAELLKKNYVTFSDADIAVQLYNFYKRKPDELTIKYEFKVFDEVMIAPLGLFYPSLFEIENDKPRKRILFPTSTDQYSGKPNNPYSKAQENLTNDLIHADMADDQLLLQMVDEKIRLKLANPYSKPKPTKTSTNDQQKYHKVLAPLEKAIIESITNAGVATDFTRVKRLYDNLLIVGGGFAKIPSFDLLLTDRINIWRPKFLSSSSMDEILEYVTIERTKNDLKKKELITQYKEKKLKERSANANGATTSSDTGTASSTAATSTTPATTAVTSAGTEEKDDNLEDIQLDKQELAEIEAMTQLELDLDYIDSISDKGQLLSVNVLPPPREFDPEVLTWKGGSVYARLKVISEMWITENDWDLLESRCLYYKSLFNY
ncbi:actin-like protein Arp8p [[Candida] anglica]|uniref:Actin-like protein Arp8p n=1 Tax=[Candida] anglica TaxID=148631 RepID=A0ABP0EMD7_9ASCO